MTTRRTFIGGAAAGAAAFPLGAWAARPASGGVTFGVVSETTIGTPLPKNPALIEDVLRFFRSKDVNAVAFLGDIMYTGGISELEKFADIWNTVFPGGRGKGGSKVELLVVTGDHDAFGWTNCWKDVPKEKQKAARFLFEDNPSKVWNRLFHQEWEPIWKKEINGYTFIGVQETRFKPDVDAFMAKAGPTLKGNKPFFFFSHYFPAGVKCGFPHLGEGSQTIARALSSYPNAVAVSGHSHIALTNEHAIWQGAYTHVCAGSIYLSSADFTYENMSSVWHPTYKKHVMRIDESIRQQGGALLVQATDTQIKIQRFHSQSGFKNMLGPLWKVPLPAQPGGAFCYDKRKTARNAPQFAFNARLTVEFCPNGHEELNPVLKGKPCYCVTIPHAKTIKAKRSGESCRVYDYVVTAKTAGKDPVERKVLAVGSTLPENMANVDSKCLFLASELAAGQQIRFTAVPRECFGLEGKPITKIFLPQTGVDTAKK